jgi:hypothetical protein
MTKLSGFSTFATVIFASLPLLAIALNANVLTFANGL